MKLPRVALFIALIVMPALLWAADAFYGTWKMRLNEVPGDHSTQLVTIVPAGDGAKVTTDIDMGNGTKMTLVYTTKLDGTPVPVYSAGKVVMTIRATKVGPNTYEGSTSANGQTAGYKTTISADGKVMTSESTSGPIKSRSVFDRVK